MILIPLLIKVGLLGGFLAVLHCTTYRYGFDIESYTGVSTASGRNGDAATSNRPDVVVDLVSSVESESLDTASTSTDSIPIMISDIVNSQQLTEEPSEDGVRYVVDADVAARKIYVEINGDNYIFNFIQGHTTHGDLAAEFCKTHGAKLGFVGADVHKSFKNCVVPLEKYLRRATQDPSVTGLSLANLELEDDWDPSSEQVVDAAAPAEENEIRFVFSINGVEYTFGFPTGYGSPQAIGEDLAKGFCEQKGEELGFTSKTVTEECYEPLKIALRDHIISLT